MSERHARLLQAAFAISGKTNQPFTQSAIGKAAEFEPQDVTDICAYLMKAGIFDGRFGSGEPIYSFTTTGREEARQIIEIHKPPTKKRFHRTCKSVLSLLGEVATQGRRYLATAVLLGICILIACVANRYFHLGISIYPLLKKLEFWR